MDDRAHTRGKKNPRAPSTPLEEAIDRATRVYDKERYHAVPVDVVAKALGYSGAKNGSALTAIATLRYYGLLERPRQGVLAVSRDVGEYKSNPDAKRKWELRRQWLRNPAIFQELLDKYESEGGLPSDEALRWEFVRRGFTDAAAGECADIFARSVSFAGYFEDARLRDAANHNDQRPEPTAVAEGAVRQSIGAVDDSVRGAVVQSPPPPVESAPEFQKGVAAIPLNAPAAPAIPSQSITTTSPNEVAAPQRIPIRLPGPGRRVAWLEVPIPFFAADKEQIRRQLDIMITDDVTEEH